MIEHPATVWKLLYNVSWDRTDLHSFLCERRCIGDVETLESWYQRGVLSDKSESLGDERLVQYFSLQALETFALLNIYKQDQKFWVFLRMCSSRNNPYPTHGRSLEIPRGEGGLKSQNFKSKV